MSELPIKLRSGRVLAARRADYDAARTPGALERMEAAGVRPFCQAPFVNLDLAPDGSITPCNHWYGGTLQARDQSSLLQVWRGPRLARIRNSMLAYELDPRNCPHCVRQVELGQYHEVFAHRQFDDHAGGGRVPPFPKRLIFRLANTCNLACIMCDGDTSSRVRAEFEKRPPAEAAYDERFFQDLREVLPHLEHVEFYGGEPFLVKEQLRVLDMIAESGAGCSIFVNTNAMVLTPRVKRYLETLNFTTIAISMDAVDPELHGAIRKGLVGDHYARNVAWYMDLAKRRNIHLLLNVTEHRKNWFELPEVFRWAEQRGIPIHVNTCISPLHVTLYTLPTAQLRYVLGYVEQQRDRLVSEYLPFRNVQAYDYLVSLIRNELGRRSDRWAVPRQPPTALSDGLLGMPIPGRGGFREPYVFARELARARALDAATEARFLEVWRTQLQVCADRPGWRDIRLPAADVPVQGRCEKQTGLRPGREGWGPTERLIDRTARVLQLGSTVPVAIQLRLDELAAPAVVVLEPGVDGEGGPFAPPGSCWAAFEPAALTARFAGQQFDLVVISRQPDDRALAVPLLRACAALLSDRGVVVAFNRVSPEEADRAADDQAAAFAAAGLACEGQRLVAEERGVGDGRTLTLTGRAFGMPDQIGELFGERTAALAAARQEASRWLAAAANRRASLDSDIARLRAAVEAEREQVRALDQQVDVDRRRMLAAAATRDAHRERLAGLSSTSAELNNRAAALIAEREQQQVALRAVCKELAHFSRLGATPAAVAAEIHALEDAVAWLRSALQLMMRSFSWRLTRPVRSAAAICGAETADAILQRSAVLSEQVRAHERYAVPRGGRAWGAE